MFYHLFYNSNYLIDNDDINDVVGVWDQPCSYDEECPFYGKNKQYQTDNNPIDAKCTNFNLNKYSKNYLNHLFNTNEILASMLLTLHNINFYQELMATIRKNIILGTFDEFHDKYIDRL